MVSFVKKSWQKVTGKPEAGITLPLDRPSGKMRFDSSIQTLVDEEKQLLKEMNKVCENQNIPELETLKKCRNDFQRLEKDLEKLQFKKYGGEGSLKKHLNKIKQDLRIVKEDYDQLKPMLGENKVDYFNIFNKIPNIIKEHEAIYNQEVARLPARNRAR